MICTRSSRSTRACLMVVALASILVIETTAFLPLVQQPSRQIFARKKSLELQASKDDDASANETPPMEKKKEEDIKPIILEPFPEAADPMYPVRGPVGEGDFVISREGGPTNEELANENILKIVLSECTDLEVNTLVWKGLGYRFDPEKKEEWNNSECFPNWREKYQTPPDLIGMQRVYAREVDQISLRSNQALVRSIPVDNKQSLKEHLKPLGWKGYQKKELTPNLTRRAQCANWLIFYREELFGYTVEELRERRQRKKEAEELAKQKEGRGDEWSPPVREVY